MNPSRNANDVRLLAIAVLALAAGLAVTMVYVRLVHMQMNQMGERLHEFQNEVTRMLPVRGAVP